MRPEVSYSIDDSYLYHIRKDGSRLFFGINPSYCFEDSYFCAGKVEDDGDVEGSIDITVSNYDETALIGAVTNDTDHDFVYFAVVKEDHVWVYNGPTAGEASMLTNDEMIANGPSHAYSFEYFTSYVYRIGFGFMLKKRI